MKNITVLLMLVLTACVETPVPVPVQFPEAPPSLLDRVPDLTPLARAFR